MLLSFRVSIPVLGRDKNEMIDSMLKGRRVTTGGECKKGANWAENFNDESIIKTRVNV